MHGILAKFRARMHCVLWYSCANSRENTHVFSQHAHAHAPRPRPCTRPHPLQTYKERLVFLNILASICIVLVQTCKEYVASLQRTLDMFPHSCENMHCTRANLQGIRSVFRVFSREIYLCKLAKNTWCFRAFLRAYALYSCKLAKNTLCDRVFSREIYPCKLAKNTWYLRAFLRDYALYSCKLAKLSLQTCKEHLVFACIVARMCTVFLQTCKE